MKLNTEIANNYNYQSYLSIFNYYQPLTYESLA